MSNFLRLVLCLTMFLGSLAYADQQVDRGESVLGGFDFSKQLITNRKLVSLFGEGCVDKDYPYFYRRMYYFPVAGIYAAFRIETDDFVVGLELTREPITATQCKAKRQLKSFGTSKKIFLGDKEEKLLKTYGNPADKEIRGNCITLYRYYGSGEAGLPLFEVELFENRVKSISIHAGD